MKEICNSTIAYENRVEVLLGFECEVSEANFCFRTLFVPSSLLLVFSRFHILHAPAAAALLTMIHMLTAINANEDFL